MSERPILLTPGPTPVPEDVRQRLAEPIFHHRTPQYRAVFQNVSERLKKVFFTQHPVYTLTGSGTLAMEAALVNTHRRKDKVLVPMAGKFAERFSHIARAYGLTVVELPVPWGEAVSVAAIEEALKRDPEIRSVCVQLCETSTAVRNDIEAIGKVCAASDALLIVDAISGLGADRLYQDAWGIDVVIAGSQKALMLPPGLAFLSMGKRAQERLKQADLPRFYADIRLYDKALESYDTPFTPALTLVLGLEKVLDKIEAQGIEKVWEKAEQMAEWTRKRFRELGMELFSKAPSAAVTAAKIPEGVDGNQLLKILREKRNVSFAGGQGPLKGKILRAAHMGAIELEDLKEGFQRLQETLEEMQYKARLAP